MKRKQYSPPTVKTLTPEQAKKIIADGKNCSEEEASKLLESLQRQKQENDPNAKAPITEIIGFFRA